MSGLFGEWQPYAVLVLAGFLPNEIWRMIGLWVGSSIDSESEILIWVRAVATAILAGVIAQILITPPGALATVPAALRIGAVVAGFVMFLLVRRSLLAGVVCGEVVLIAGKWWLG
jgi:branched-subunit amino acid transport protein